MRPALRPREKRRIGTALRGWALPLALSAGCINTDAAVFVEAGIDGANVAVTQGALGASLSGSFLVTLHLGARASGDSDVTFGAFVLEKSDRSEVVLDSLPVSTTTPSPVKVEPDSDVDVEFSISTGDQPIAQDVADRVCAGELVVSGVIEDSLSTKSTPIVSEPFSPIGCP